MVAGQLQHTNGIQPMLSHILLRNSHSPIPAAVIHDDDLIREVRALPVSPPLQVPVCACMRKVAMSSP